MKKSLLFAAALFAATSGFALDENQVVYTLNGRYVVTGSENLISNGSFAGGNFDGWSVLSATEGATMDAVFNYVSATEDTPEGIKSQSGANTEGIKIALPNINDASGHYVVSVTITAPEGLVPNFNFRNSNPDALTSVQLFNILGTAGENAELGDKPQVANFGAWQEIYPGTNTYYFGIDGDNIARSYTLEMLGFDPQLIISDIQVMEADKIADDRQVSKLVDYAKALLTINNVTSPDGDDMYLGLQEVIDGFDELGETPSQEVMNEYVEGLNENITAFEKLTDDFLPNAIDKLPLGTKRVDKSADMGCWKATDGAVGRLFQAAGIPYELGHFQNGNTWGGGNGCLGIAAKMSLQPGTYVFSIDCQALARESKKSTWSNNTGLSYADATICVKPAVEVAEGEEAPEALVTYNFSPKADKLEKSTISFTVETAGDYEISLKTWAKEAYKGLTYGSVVYVQNARMYGKSANAEYTKAELDYCEAVKVQITTARNEIEKAKEYLEDATRPWGKAALKEAITASETETEKYEAMDDVAIIETFDSEVYDLNVGLEATTQDGDLARMLEAEVYVNAAKGILAANKAFIAKNDSLAVLANAINAANETKEQRVYGLATGKADLEAVIAAAVSKDAALRADEYSEENVVAVNEAVAALNEAVEAFKASIPAENIKTLVDLSGNLSAVSGEITSENGTGTMIISNFSENPNDGGTAFAIGYILGEEQAFPNLLRVGNGNATVDLDGIAEDAIVQVSFDYYYGNLTTKYASFNVNTVNTTVTGEGEEAVETTTTETICGLNVSKYDGKADVNTFGIDVNAELTAVGASGNENENIAAESNKNSYTISIDLLTKEMSCNIVSAKGTFNHTATNAVEGVPTQFVVGSNYNNSNRRSFFGNLVIRAIQGGEYDGIKETVAKSINNGKIYNAAGMEVKSFVKGINIVNGKKFVK